MRLVPANKGMSEVSPRSLKKNKKSFKNVLTFQKLNDIINM